jgi:exopolyphosphatase/pppGpp-phosphohydrolase
LFRTVATESAKERARNPGLPAAAVDRIVAACCILVAVMRHLHLDQVDVGRPS